MFIRILLVATTIGTNDAVFMTVWANLANKYGVARAYSMKWELNHPPLSLFIVGRADRAARLARIEPTDGLRLIQVLADGVTAFCLLLLSRRDGDVRPFVAIAYLLCPAAIFVSAFHCNTDATMIAFLMAAFLCSARGQPALAGVLFACAFNIKIVALFAVAIALVAGAQRLRVAIVFALTSSALLLPTVFLGGPVVLRNIFGYSGYAGKWGFPALALTLESLLATPRTTPLYQMALAYANWGKYFVLLAIGMLALWLFFRTARGASSALAGVAVAFCLLLFLAPGFGVQYLLWPLPFLPFALRRAEWITAWFLTSVYLFGVYTIWSQGFPWWYADSIARTPGKEFIVPVGLGLWVVFGYAAQSGWKGMRQAAASDESARD